MVMIVTDPAYALHLTGPGHPEQPARIQAILQALIKADLLNSHTLLMPRKATDEDILLCHSPEYLQLLKAEVASCSQLKNDDGSTSISTGDAQICSKSYEIACLASGGVLEAIDTVMEQKTNHAFCAVRPPGHHATRSTGMGFCLLNNVAIGARYLQRTYGLGRVAIIDWDVHHGNGTQDIFYTDPSVFYFSTHQHPLYPGTGMVHEKGAGNILNCPIPGAKNSRDLVFEAFTQQLIPAMNSFKPEFILISAGFDAHAADPLGGFNLLESDFADLTTICQKIAAHYCKNRIVSVLEGGYSLSALAASVVSHCQALQ